MQAMFKKLKSDAPIIGPYSPKANLPCGGCNLCTKGWIPCAPNDKGGEQTMIRCFGPDHRRDPKDIRGYTALSLEEQLEAAKTAGDSGNWGKAARLRRARDGTDASVPFDETESSDSGSVEQTRRRRVMERLLRYETHFSSGAEGYPP